MPAPIQSDMLDQMVYVKKEMPEVLFREEHLDGEPIALLFDASGKQLFHIRGNGGEVWKLIDGRRTIRMIAEELASREGEESTDELLRDVVKLIVKLGENDLIKYGYRLQ